MRIHVPVMAVLFGFGLAGSAFARDDNQGHYWGAISAAVQGSNAVVRVVTDLPSRAAAEQAAMAECRKAGVGGCRIGSVFADGGCGYATTGSAPRGKTGATVGWGKSPQDAINSCREQGGVCDRTPIGFCAKEAIAENRCRGDGSDAAAAIAACSREISSGQYQGTELAVSYYTRAQNYKKSGDSERAIADYSEAIRLDPKDPDARVNRGLLYRAKGEYDNALADYNEAIRLNPKDARAYNSRGYAYAGKKDYDRAIADYNQAIRLKPNYESSLHNRADAYEEKNQYSLAIADYDQIVRLHPDDDEALNSRCWARAIVGDLNSALTDCTASLGLKPEAANTLDSRALVYLKLGQLDKALADYDAVLKLNPKLAGSLYGRGVVKRKQGDVAGGEADIAAATAIRADLAQKWSNYGVNN